MDDRTRRALSRGHLIDITTTGRRSGRPRRIEIVFHVIDGRIYISGMPGRARSWLANMRTDPRFTFHLKGVVRADLPAVARQQSEPGWSVAEMEAYLRRFHYRLGPEDLAGLERFEALLAAHGLLAAD